MDLNHTFRSGKYAGRTVGHVYKTDKRYFNWILENRPEMLKSHKGTPQQARPSFNTKPTYVDPPDVSDKERGVIRGISPNEAFLD